MTADRIATVEPAAQPAERLCRIQEAAQEVGLTTRSIRYYEELGLLKPAARSEGAYRLYDASDLDRLRYIKGLRDDAGFSLAEIGLLLEDEVARRRNHAAFHATDDPVEQATLLGDSIARLDRQSATLRAKIARLAEMAADVDGRRQRLVARLDEVERLKVGR